MSGLFGGNGDDGQSALNAQLAKQQAQQDTELKQEQANEETTRGQLEAQRIAALRGRFGADTASDGTTGTPSQTTTQSAQSLYAMLTGQNI